MAKDITFNTDHNVLCFKAIGEQNSKTRVEFAEKLLNIAKEFNCWKVLCDYTQSRVTAGTLEIYRIPSQLEQIGIPRYFKIAVIYSSDKESYIFWETRARNADFTTRVFTDKDEALKWLNSFSKNQPQLTLCDV